MLCQSTLISLRADKLQPFNHCCIPGTPVVPADLENLPQIYDFCSFHWGVLLCYQSETFPSLTATPFHFCLSNNGSGPINNWGEIRESANIGARGNHSQRPTVIYGDFSPNSISPTPRAFKCGTIGLPQKPMENPHNTSRMIDISGKNLVDTLTCVRASAATSNPRLSCTFDEVNSLL